MDNAVLEAQVRDKALAAKNVRKQDMIPANYYGHGVENVSLMMDYQTFRRLFRKAGENTVITLKIDGVGDKKVLVHHVEYHPVTDAYNHVEFINVRMDEKVTTHVAIHLEGTAPAVKDLGGVLMQNLDELEIKCLPGDLIHEVSISVESLVDFHTALHVSDLKVPGNIEVLNDPDQTVASVQAPREEEDLDAPVDDGIEREEGEEGEEGAEGEAAEGGEEAAEGEAKEEAKEEGGE